MPAAFQRRTYQPGELIFRQGDPGTHLYFVEKGAVVIWRRAADDRRDIVGRAGTGALFGEMAIMDRKPRMANASAEGETVVLEIPATTVREAMHEADPMLIRLIHGLLDYIRDLAGQLQAARQSAALPTSATTDPVPDTSAER